MIYVLYFIIKFKNNFFTHYNSFPVFFIILLMNSVFEAKCKILYEIYSIYNN